MQTPSQQAKAALSSRSFIMLCLFILVITLYRAWVLLHMPGDLSLQFDEAQYWLWSQHLQWGYYSKPPLLPAVIDFFTRIFGNTEPGVRSATLFFYPATTLIIYALAHKISQNPRIALWSGIIFISMPGVSLSSMLITTDVVLFLCWSLSCFFFYLAVTENKIWQWLAVGIFAGLGLLTKYSMAIFALSALLWLVVVPDLRHHLKNPRLWFAALLSLLIFLPNMYWNWQHNWPSIRHTSELSSEGLRGLHPLTAINFLAEQFGVFGLISYLGYILWIIGTFITKKHKPKQEQWFILCFSLTFLLVISLQALKGRAYANWAAPTYAMASIAVAYWVIGNKYGKVALLVTNLLLMAIVYNGDALYSWARPDATHGPDPMKTLRAWHSWRNQLENDLAHCGPCDVIIDGRESAAQFMYQLRNTHTDLLYWNPKHNQSNQYEMDYSLKKPRQGKFLLVLEHPPNAMMQASFDAIKPINTFSRKGKYKVIDTYHIFEAYNFKGYTQ